uniref:Uncharacterized protein n=1 Tax=Neogobius melanostomus TaxID=47308 RepID=A0A8C6WU40_9GOBI
FTQVVTLNSKSIYLCITIGPKIHYVLLSGDVLFLSRAFLWLQAVIAVLFCQNACVMYKMRTYISLVEGLRDRRCSYTRDVRRLGHTLRQLFIIMSEKCHGVR